MILGWFMAGRLGRGRDGIHIREYGLAGRICHSDWDSELDGTADLDGAGAIGDLTGADVTPHLVKEGITRAATRFTTEGISTAAEQERAEDSTTQEVEWTEHAEETLRGRIQTGLRMRAQADEREFTTVLEPRRERSTETVRPHEDMRHREDKAERDRVPLVDTTTADRREAIRHAEAAAWVAEERELAEAEERAAAVGAAGRISKRRLAMMRAIHKD
jgi:hypothetical protein